MKPSHYKLLFGLMTVGFISLSCQFPEFGSFNQGQQTISDQAQGANEVLDTVATQLEGDSKIITMTFSETQINSLASEEFSIQADGLLSDPTIDLKQDQIIVSGKINQGILSINMNLVLEPFIDQNGIPNVKLVKADLGPIPAPEGLNQQVSAIFSPILAKAVNNIGPNIKLESITVTEETLTITGQRP